MIHILKVLRQYDMQAPRDSHTCFCLFSFCLFVDVAFSEFLSPLSFSLCMESTSYVCFSTL